MKRNNNSVRSTKLASLSLFALASSALVASSQADILALWTFEESPPAATGITIGPLAASSGIFSASAVANGFHTSSATVWDNPVGNGSNESWSSNNFTVGDYYQFEVPTTGYEDIVVTWAQVRSGTGPATWDFAYSLNGTDFTVFSNDYAVLTTPAFSSTTPRPELVFTVDLSSVAAVENASMVYFRLVVDSAPGASGGTSRVDNFQVATVPEPTTVMSLLGGLTVLATARRRRK